MTLAQALSVASRMLSSGGIENAPLVCELLLRHVLKISKVQLYLDLDQILTLEQEEAFRQLVQRSLNGEPVAYITAHREFYGLDFYVDPRVLVPRPESELLVDMALDTAKRHDISSIADIGTGCGAIAISLALNLPKANIYATDISTSALDVAIINRQKYRLEKRIRFLQGDLLEPLPESVDLIIANLPYVRNSEIVPGSAISFEPHLALNGGSDGLKIISKLCHQAGNKLHPAGHLLMEIGQGQSEAVNELMRSLFPSAMVEVKTDLNGIERVVSLALP